MTSISTAPAGSSNSNPLPRTQTGTGHFMLTLCRLAAPVSIRPPQSPHLKQYTFFTSRAPQPDGSERLYLHMGYFETLADAERWVEAIRGRYPDAIATIAPAKNESLTDTQVLKVLETRDAFPGQSDAAERNGDPIGLLRPEDTGTRQALREAVAQGAPVSFAVQLHWSAEPIDLSRVPSLAVFKTHTLYGIESRREGRCRYFLRMGFFPDPVAAKQVAMQVRANFANAAVVPVDELEVTRAREAAMGGSSIPHLAQQRVEPASDPNITPPAATEPKRLSDKPRRVVRGAETLEQTLKQLAERELWTDPDTLSESGVRHLKVEVQKHASGRT